MSKKSSSSRVSVLGGGASAVGRSLTLGIGAVGSIEGGSAVVAPSAASGSGGGATTSESEGASSAESGLNSGTGSIVEMGGARSGTSLSSGSSSGGRSMLSSMVSRTIGAAMRSGGGVTLGSRMPVLRDSKSKMESLSKWLSSRAGGGLPRSPRPAADGRSLSSSGRTSPVSGSSMAAASPSGESTSSRSTELVGLREPSAGG